MNHIILRESELKNVIEFIEEEFIDSIRRDEDIDNIDYIIDMMNALQTLRHAVHRNRIRHGGVLCKFD